MNKWESVGTNGGLREQAVPAGVSHLDLTFERNEKLAERRKEAFGPEEDFS